MKTTCQYYGITKKSGTFVTSVSTANQKMIHPTANLYGDYKIGKGTKIGAFCDIGGKVGRSCKVQCHVSIPPLTVIEDDVFLGPRVSFANDPNMDGKMVGTLVKKGAKIGMGALIQGGITVGKSARIGMGAVVLKSVPDGETVVGLYK